MFTTLLFLSATFMEPFLCHSQLVSRFIDGRLSDSWNMNFTFYSRNLEGNILYLADYERNYLLITIITNSNKDKNISIWYNKENQSTNITQLCGCNPCNAKMMSMYIASLSRVIQVTCNQYGHLNVPRIDITNRVNIRLPEAIKTSVDIVGINHIYTSIPVKEAGCLKSLYYNGQTILFNAEGPKFLSSCPRNCLLDECNDGRCWPTYPIGPICDCSATAFGGPNCNDSMIEYSSDSLHSYTKISLINDISIKLSWKPKLSNKKYCLLNFVNEYVHVIFSTHQNFVLMGPDVVATTYDKKINFININVTNHGVSIEVNDVVTNVRPALLGNLSINVGFTKTKKLCDTFEGSYHFLYNKSQLRPVVSINAVTDKVSNVSTGSFKMYVIMISIGFLVTIFLLIAVYLSIRSKTVPQAVAGSISMLENKYTLDNESGYYEKVRDDTSYELITAHPE